MARSDVRDAGAGQQSGRGRQWGFRDNRPLPLPSRSDSTFVSRLVMRYSARHGTARARGPDRGFASPRRRILCLGGVASLRGARGGRACLRASRAGGRAQWVRPHCTCARPRGASSGRHGGGRPLPAIRFTKTRRGGSKQACGGGGRWGLWRAAARAHTNTGVGPRVGLWAAAGRGGVGHFYCRCPARPARVQRGACAAAISQAVCPVLA